MADRLTSQQTLRLSLLAAVVARDVLGLLNAESLLVAQMRLAQVIQAVSSIDAELKKIKQEVPRG